jgi:hypothetical protein
MVKQPAPESPPTLPSVAEERAQSPAYDIARQIGEKLRTMFDGVLTEPVPDRFRRLLQELERTSSKAPATDPGASGPTPDTEAKPPAST